MARNLDTAIPLRSADNELQSTRELRTTATQIAAPKPGSRRQSGKATILKHFKYGILEGKSAAPKWKKSSCQITIATLMQPVQYDLRLFSCKDISSKHAAAAARNLDAAIPLRSAETELEGYRMTHNGYTSNLELHCARKSSRTRRQSDDA